MRDLRVRLGVILALALLPLLVFAVGRSYFDYQQDKALYDSNTELTARVALAETSNSFEATKSILRLISNLSREESCEKTLEDVIKAYDKLYNVIRADRNGRVICSAKPVRKSDAEVINLIGKLSEDTPYATKILSLPSLNDEPENVIVTVMGVYEGGRLINTYAAIEDIDLLLNALQKSRVLENSELAVFGQSGHALGGTWNTENFQNIVRSLPPETIKGRYKTVDENGNSVIFLPTPADQIYLAVTSKKQNDLKWNKLNPLTSAIIPILAWIFGFIAIWLSTDQLILIHIRRMRAATVSFARGDRTARVGSLNNPPPSIHALGKNFDIMANRIVEREETITDALDEKETLLREIHHRVKNNLQIIISLLNMQERKLTDKEGSAAIIEARSRINAIALVHRGLYESSDLRVVNMDTFLTRLLPELTLALGLEERNIEITTFVKCDLLEADTATPVALFIVEALTNAVKHGVSQGGHINVELSQNDHTLKVSVSDNGATASESVTEPKGIGTKLMKGFARQLGGTVETNINKNGYKTTLSFMPRNMPSI